MRSFRPIALYSWAVIFCLALRISAEVREGKFVNRDGWTLTAQRLRVTVLQSGGHIGEIALIGSGSVNPLWIPQQPTMETEQYSASRDSKRFGGGSAARLLASLLGHNLCFPFWGDPSPAEAAAGMTYHGETGIVRWKKSAGGDDFMILTASLPESGMSVTRTFRTQGQVLEVQTTAKNEKTWDRPVSWCEHATLGAPFLERGVTVMEASLTRGRTTGNSTEFKWPSGYAEKLIDLRTVRALPESPGFVNNFLVNTEREYGFVAAWHPRYRLVFGYVFPRSDYRWLNIWESNSAEMFTRGLEFCSTPVHGTVRTLMKTPELWGVPTFEWLDAQGEIRKRFWAFSVQTPADFKGIGDVRYRPGSLQVAEAGGLRVLDVPMH